MEPLTRKQIKQFHKLSDEDKEEYLRIRLYEEADTWVKYFMVHQQDLERRLSHRFIISPKQM